MRLAGATFVIEVARFNRRVVVTKNRLACVCDVELTARRVLLRDYIRVCCPANFLKPETSFAFRPRWHEPAEAARGSCPGRRRIINDNRHGAGWCVSAQHRREETGDFHGRPSDLFPGRFRDRSHRLSSANTVLRRRFCVQRDSILATNPLLARSSDLQTTPAGPQSMMPKLPSFTAPAVFFSWFAFCLARCSRQRPFAPLMQRRGRRYSPTVCRDRTKSLRAKSELRFLRLAMQSSSSG